MVTQDLVDVTVGKIWLEIEMEMFGGERLREITRTFVLETLRDNPAIVIQGETAPLGGQRYHVHWRWVI